MIFDTHCIFAYTLSVLGPRIAPAKPTEHTNHSLEFHLHEKMAEKIVPQQTMSIHVTCFKSIGGSHRGTRAPIDYVRGSRDAENLMKTLGISESTESKIFRVASAALGTIEVQKKPLEPANLHKHQAFYEKKGETMQVSPKMEN